MRGVVVCGREAALAHAVSVAAGVAQQAAEQPAPVGQNERRPRSAPTVGSDHFGRLDRTPAGQPAGAIPVRCVPGHVVPEVPNATQPPTDLPTTLAGSSPVRQLAFDVSPRRGQNRRVPEAGHAGVAGHREA